MSFAFEATFFRDLMLQAGVKPERLLVVGCGAGVEVSHLAEATNALVVGVDLDVNPAWRRPGVLLLRADARRLPFRDGAFDAVYCYHVLEHVPEPQRAVAEARRSLREGGAGYFGTPNKTRLVGYIGGRATTWEKVWWNALDWSRRLRGRWSNELGAHAGFTSAELSRMLSGSFAVVEREDLPYYLGKYPRLAAFWRAVFRLGLASVVAPSVYFRTRCREGAPPVR